MRISDWSSDVCSSDLLPAHPAALRALGAGDPAGARHRRLRHRPPAEPGAARGLQPAPPGLSRRPLNRLDSSPENEVRAGSRRLEDLTDGSKAVPRSEEHTSELQSLMRIPYAVFCLKKKKKR